MFEVITGSPKPTPDFCRIYFDAFLRKLQDYRDNPENTHIVKQIVFYGVKWANTNGKPTGDYEVISSLWTLYSAILDYIGSLTPTELVSIFSIEKRYDGDRTETKDYYSTVAALDEIGMDEKMGTERAFSLLWDYQNNDLREFLVHYMSIMSAMRQFDGKPGIMEEWAEDNGIETFRTHTDEATGQEYIQSSRTGKTAKARQAIPRYMKIIK